MVFEAVAAHRFRDISEEVRSVVIVGIGNWIELLPSMFLQDAYLKYLAWALSDKVGAGLCFMHVDMNFPGSPCTKTGFDEHASPRSNCHCTGNRNLLLVRQGAHLRH